MLEQKAETDQMQSDGLNALRRRLTWVLNRIGVDSEPMHLLEEKRVAILTREHLAVSGPTTR
jgi:hypothetical protein